MDVWAHGTGVGCGELILSPHGKNQRNAPTAGHPRSELEAGLDSLNYTDK